MKQTEPTPAPPLTDALHIRASRPGDYEQIAAIMNLPGVRHGTLRLPHTRPEQIRAWLESPFEGGLLLVAERKAPSLEPPGFTGKRDGATTQRCSE